MDKEEILNKIIELQTQKEINDSDYKELSVSEARINEVFKEIEKAFLELKAQRDNAASELELRRVEKRRIADKQKALTRDVESLQRQLSRIVDTERIEKEYQEQVEHYKKRCLEAPWRAENRMDGMGALPYQIDGAIHLSIAGSGFLGDKRGLGKTLTSLIYCDYNRSQRIIIVSPSDTMDNFDREIKLWSNRTPIKIKGMSKAERDFLLPHFAEMPAYTVLLNYEAWRKDPDLIPQLIAMKADTLLLDEAHRGKNLSTQTAQGLQQLRFGCNVCPNCDNPFIILNDINSAHCENCKYEGKILEFCSIKNVLPMTGTPILNKPQELFPNLRLIDPYNFAYEKQFLNDFCEKGYDNRWRWREGATKKITDIIGPRYLARDRNSAGIEIPPAKPLDHVITWDEFESNYPAQAKAYRQVRDYAQIVLDADLGVTKSFIVFLEVLLRLRQVLVWPAGIKLEKRDEEGNVLFKQNLNVYESAKLDKAEELIREITEEGDRTVLFSQFKDPLKELEQRLPQGDMRSNKIPARPCRYDGDTSHYMKEAIELDFDPKTAPKDYRWDVVLGNYKSMGVGLNLNSASHLIMLDREWNPGNEDQAEGRIDRIGTTKSATIHKIIVEGTVDAWMAKLIDEKREMIDGFEANADTVQSFYDALRNGDV